MQLIKLLRSFFFFFFSTWKISDSHVRLVATATPDASSSLSKGNTKVYVCPESISSRRSQEHKLIAVSSVAIPAQFSWRQDVSCRTTVVAAVTLKSIVLTPPFYECKDGVLLLWRWQSLGKWSGKKCSCYVNINSQISFIDTAQLNQSALKNKI